MYERGEMTDILGGFGIKTNGEATMYSILLVVLAVAVLSVESNGTLALRYSR
jgi:hypothetical protein